jgi:hypothetical protein
MGKVLWHTMMSLDGFIAGPNDGMDWMSDIDGGEGRVIDEVVGSTGALLVGRRTQDVEDRDQPDFYGGAYRCWWAAGCACSSATGAMRCGFGSSRRHRKVRRRCCTTR